MRRANRATTLGRGRWLSVLVRALAWRGGAGLCGRWSGGLRRRWLGRSRTSILRVMVASNVDSGPWTVSRLLAWTRDYFGRQGVESPRLCAELLLAHAMGCPRIRLYTQYEAVPSPDVLDRYREAVKAATAGTPIAYLTGVKEFFSLEFEVTPDVLIPRPETEILVERTVRLLRESEAGRHAAPGAEDAAGGQVAPGAGDAAGAEVAPGGEDTAVAQAAPCAEGTSAAEVAPEGPASAAGRKITHRILDLGTGSGCIAVALAKNLPDAALFASDISEAATNVARRNAARHGVAERIEFRVGDLFAPWDATREGAAEANASSRRERGPADHTGATRPGSATVSPGSALFDVIVSNPPYVATAPGTPVAENVRKYEPHAALFAGPDGLDVIRRIIAEAPRWLAPNGHLLMEMAFDQAHKVCGLLNSSHWQHVTTYRDAAGYERVVHARRPADAAAVE